MSNNKQYRPIGPRVLVELIKETEEICHGFVIPDTVRQQKQHARVLALGTKTNKANTIELPFPVKVGDIVMFCKGRGLDVADNQQLVAVDELFYVVTEGK